MLGRLRNWLPPCATVAIGWLLISLYCYPGFLTFDSFEQLSQARHFRPVSDWHPPLMSIIWRWLDKIVAGPYLMVLLQSGLLLGGLYALFARMMRPWLAVAVTLFVFLWPPVITSQAVVWKDPLMAGFLVA